MIDNVKVVKQGGGPVYPDEYVSDGLYFCLDAINNAGDHHDANADSWIDTIGGIEFTQNDSELPIIGDNFIYFDGTNRRYHNTVDVLSLAEPVYCEFVVQIERNMVYMIVQQADKNTLGTTLGTLNYRSMTENCELTAKSGGTYNGIKPTIGTVITLGGTKRQGVSYNGSAVFSRENAAGFSVTTTEFIVGGYKNNTYPFLGYLCAVRYYNRVLSSAEIAQNYEQDVKRFGAGGSFELEDLFNALPTLNGGTSKTIGVNPEKLAEATPEVIAIATVKGWTVA